MDLTLDRKKRKVTGDAVSLSESVVASLKLSHEEFVRVKLLDDGADAELATGEAIVLVLKPEGQFEGDAIQIATLTTSDLKLGRYEKLFSTQTDAGRALLGIDGNSANDVSSKRIIGALVYVPAVGEPREADEFYINFRNAVYQAGDTEVDAVDGPGALLTARAVRHDIEQTISTEGKGRARANIDAAAATHSHSDLAPKESPALTGTPTAPTAAPGTSTAQIANTEFVALAMAALVASSPAALDTLNELATALANDPNFATTMTNALAGKVPTSRNVNTSGLASGGGSLGSDRTIDVPLASQPEAEAGTNNTKAMTPLRVAQAIAALASAGGGGQLPKWAYVDPVAGSDSTGDGTAASPWQTIQKAVVTEDRDFIIIAPGNAGALNLPQSARNLCVLGAGREQTTIAGITVTDGGSLTIQDIGMYSVNITGILCIGSETFPDGGDLTMTGVWSVNDSCGSLGASRSTPNTSGGNGGIVRAFRCRLINLSSNGGNGSDGVSGEPGDPGGNGGNGGSVEVEHSFISGQLEAVGGPGGSDAGAGIGSQGNSGSLYARFCEIGSIGDGSQDVHGCIVSLTWTD